MVAADAVAAVLRTMAADSANIVLIDIFRLLVRSGVIAAILLSTQTPAASDLPSIMSHQPWINAGKRWRVFGGSSGAADSLSTVSLGADTSQQAFLTTLQHA